MSAVIESYSTADSTGATTTITKPTGLTAGEVLIAVVAYAYDSSGGRTFDTPAGWTKIVEVDDVPVSSGSDTNGTAHFFKVADSGDASASDFSFTAPSADYTCGFLFRVSGLIATGTNDTYGSGSWTPTTSNPSLSMSVSPTHVNLVYVGSVLKRSDGGAPTGLTLNTNNPTWTDYGDISMSGVDVDNSHVLSVFVAVQETATSFTSVTVNGTSLYDGTFIVTPFYTQQNATASNALHQTSPVTFATLTGSTQTVTNNLHTATPDIFTPTTKTTNKTNWQNETKPTTSWTNEQL